VALTGRCLCGAIAYGAGEPLSTLICHCTECRRQSGAVASLFVLVERASLDITGDTLATWETVGSDTGQRRERVFCSRCGSPIVTYLAELEGFAAIKAGALDDIADLVPEGEIWCDSALPWWPESEDRGRFARGMPMG
jgi:hypothetical protein